MWDDLRSTKYIDINAHTYPILGELKYISVSFSLRLCLLFTIAKVSYLHLQHLECFNEIYWLMVFFFILKAFDMRKPSSCQLLLRRGSMGCWGSSYQ